MFAASNYGTNILLIDAVVMTFAEAVNYRYQYPQQMTWGASNLSFDPIVDMCPFLRNGRLQKWLYKYCEQILIINVL